MGKGTGTGEKWRWTQEDDARLRELAPQRLGSVAIARDIGRTRPAVQQRAFSEGISILRPRKMPEPGTPFAAPPPTQPYDPDAALRARWARLIGRMKAELREAIEAGV